MAIVMHITVPTSLTCVLSVIRWSSNGFYVCSRHSAYELGIEMTDHGHAGDLVGPYVLEACSPDEMRSVAEHASHCPACAAEIAALSQVTGWIGATTARAPAPELRSRVLSAALAKRPARPTGRDGDAEEARRLGELYRVQVVQLDRLLSGLSQPHWLSPSGPHRSVRDLVVHLYDNDELVADVTDVHRRPSTSDVRLTWRGQADAIVDVVARQGGGLLERPVQLAGRAAPRRPLREALIQRGFETWIHAEDVRAMLDLPPQSPSAQQVADIVDFALRLLPAAMEAAGRAHPDKSIRLVLTGEGGGSRSVALSPTVGGTVVAEISLPADRFCRLLAGRLAATSASAEVDGDPDAVHDFLTVAATMGCD
jgi:uncharacterized protein (TIGR03083 family)